MIKILSNSEARNINMVEDELISLKEDYKILKELYDTLSTSNKELLSEYMKLKNKARKCGIE